MYYFFQPVYLYSPYARGSYRANEHVPYADPRLLYQHANSLVRPVETQPNKAQKIAQRQPTNTPAPKPNQQNPYPPVDSDLLYQSANESKKLMEDASKVLERLSTSRDFDTRIMDHAQQSDMEEVKRLIDSIGITSKVDIHFNPDGLRLEFSSEVEGSDCCKLTISLRWL
ncbi:MULTISPECIES: hypothetical protein [Lysinibacillus]|uniref:Inner spore coat protein n=1 Tax=Lysinibacillus antri TaxID=2498145 RepID=A0A3S0P4M4_9BACI|nr:MULTISPECIES: hypothetical protein [Lysinibacillus]RUL49880.1 hypothetical protein EK386_14490 [Lysinibacillus antri]TSI05077.1 hypothetical protein FJQ64_12220 [Lysinibacillus sp. BW-2-10]